jgi:hypothetical protein
MPESSVIGTMSEERQGRMQPPGEAYAGVEMPGADEWTDLAARKDRGPEDRQSGEREDGNQMPRGDQAGADERILFAGTAGTNAASSQLSPAALRVPHSSPANAAEHVRSLREEASLRTPVSNVVIELEGHGTPPVRLRLSHGAGPVRLEVHSPEETVRQLLRTDLTTLVSRLEGAGYDAEVTPPQAANPAELAIEPAMDSAIPVGFDTAPADGAGRNDPQPGRPSSSNSDRKAQRGPSHIRR